MDKKKVMRMNSPRIIREPKPDEGRLLTDKQLRKRRKELFPYGHKDCYECEQFIVQQTASIKDAEWENLLQTLREACAESKKELLAACKARIKVLIDECARLSGGKYREEDYIKRLKATHTIKGEEG